MRTLANATQRTKVLYKTDVSLPTLIAIALGVRPTSSVFGLGARVWLSVEPQYVRLKSYRYGLGEPRRPLRFSFPRNANR
jgi:hypothetical protein